MGERGVGVAAIFRLNRPEFAAEGAGEEVDALVARGEVQAGANLGGDFVMEPDIGELGAIRGRGAKMVADDVLEGCAAFERRNASERRGKIRPRGNAIKETELDHDSSVLAGHVKCRKALVGARNRSDMRGWTIK